MDWEVETDREDHIFAYAYGGESPGDIPFAFVVEAKNIAHEKNFPRRLRRIRHETGEVWVGRAWLVPAIPVDNGCAFLPLVGDPLAEPEDFPAWAPQAVLYGLAVPWFDVGDDRHRHPTEWVDVTAERALDRGMDLVEQRGPRFSALFEVPGIENLWLKLATGREC